MPTQLPRVPSLIPSSFATLAIGRDVSITIFTASSLNSGEKLFLGRGNYFTFPDGPSYWMDCPEGSGHLKSAGPRAGCARSSSMRAAVPTSDATLCDDSARGRPEGVAADEAQQPGLGFGVLGHLDPGPVLARGAHA